MIFRFLFSIGIDLCNRKLKQIILKQTDMRNTKQLLIGLAMSLLPLGVSADERPVKFEQLPAKAQEVIVEHFKGFDLSYAKYDNDLADQSYDVIFTNGSKIEFSRRGEWEKIECRREACVPKSLLPSKMTQYLNANYKGAEVKEIERNLGSFDVKLANGIELIFDSNGTFKRYDR